MDLKRLDEKLDKLLEMGVRNETMIAGVNDHLLAVSANAKKTDEKLDIHLLDDGAHGARALHKWGALSISALALLRSWFH